MTTRDADITRLLNDLGEGDEGLALVLPLMYDELHALSQRYLRQERADHTLQATALVHEAYVSLASGKRGPWKNRSHFFRVAARAMRHILINHALAHKAQKRGGGRQRLILHEATVALENDEPDMLDVDEALTRLAAIDEHKARVVELRFFAGCTMDQVAQALDVSLSTVERDWRFARAWLRTELSSSSSDPAP